MSYQIIPAQIADVPHIVKLVNSAYRGETAKIGWTSETNLLEGVRVDEEELTGYFENPQVTLLKYANSEGVINGFVYLEAVEGSRLYLGMLTVNPFLQDGGIGRKLLNAAEQVAFQKGCVAIKISVINSRTKLVDWYERRGFVATGQTMPLITTKSVAKEPITLMIMEKPL